MTENDFRRLALSLPQAEESSHMQHPDFRANGKIFATLRHPEKGWGMVKLTPEQQDMFIDLAPDVFQPVKGGWGVKGATNVNLKNATKKLTREALMTAWTNVTSPKGRGKASR